MLSGFPWKLNVSQATFAMQFSLAPKRFLINLRLALGGSKTQPLSSNSWNRISFSSPRFMDTDRFDSP